MNDFTRGPTCFPVRACACGCPTEMHVGEIGCPCALPGEPPCDTGSIKEALDALSNDIGSWDAQTEREAHLIRTVCQRLAAINRTSGC